MRIGLILIFAAVALASANPVAAQDVSAPEVRQAIKRGKQFLLNEQQPDGSWRKFSTYEQGTTALSLLALLNCGVDPNDPKIKKAIDKVNSVADDNLTTYVASLRVMSLCAADPKAYRTQIEHDVHWLIEAQSGAGTFGGTGGWGYVWHDKPDASNSQFALLALHEARQIGVEVPQAVWVAAKSYWDDRFDDTSGGFSYKSDARNNPYGSMTCAGISSMIIIDENLKDMSHAVGDDGAVRCCRPQIRIEKLSRAIAWMEKYFGIRNNPGTEISAYTTYYYLYGLERAGRLAGRRFFGEYDWYRLGAAELIKRQSTAVGSWEGTGVLGESEPVIATSFALLFLSKGKRPIVLGKYKYTDNEDQWDPHPLGVHHLTQQLEKVWNLKLNWQAIDARRATANDLNEAEVLVITGKNQLDLNNAQKQALKLYLENGKFILAEAAQGDGCGDASEFDGKFRALVKELFPGNELPRLNRHTRFGVRNSRSTPSSWIPTTNVRCGDWNRAAGRASSIVRRTFRVCGS